MNPYVLYTLREGIWETTSIASALHLIHTVLRHVEKRRRSQMCSQSLDVFI